MNIVGIVPIWDAVESDYHSRRTVYLYFERKEYHERVKFGTFFIEDVAAFNLNQYRGQYVRVELPKRSVRFFFNQKPKIVQTATIPAT